MCKIEANNLVRVIKALRIEFRDKMRRRREELELIDGHGGGPDNTHFLQLLVVVNNTTTTGSTLSVYQDILADHPEDDDGDGDQADSAERELYGRLCYDHIGELYDASGRVVCFGGLMVLGIMQGLVMPCLGGPNMWQWLAWGDKAKKEAKIKDGNEDGPITPDVQMSAVWVVKNESYLEDDADHCSIVFRHIESVPGDLVDEQEVGGVLRSIVEQYLG